MRAVSNRWQLFLSIQAQDFIEDDGAPQCQKEEVAFLSIQAQDFIEERRRNRKAAARPHS